MHIHRKLKNKKTPPDVHKWS